MPLVKSPRMTPAKLAANRANARKCTGPRTPEGKRRVMLNALKHGRYARTEKLIEGGADSGLLDWIRAQIVACYQPQGERGRRTTEQLTREVYCSFVPGPKLRRQELGRGRRLPTRSSLWAMRWVKWREGGLETEPRYAVKSVDNRVTSPFPLRVRLRLRGEARELVFWVRARRDTVGLSLNRLLRLAEEALEGWAAQTQSSDVRASRGQTDWGGAVGAPEDAGERLARQQDAGERPRGQRDPSPGPDGPPSPQGRGLTKQRVARVATLSPRERAEERGASSRDHPLAPS